jgi:hypothetical protein
MTMCVLCSQLWVDDHWSDAAISAQATSSAVVALETHASRRGQRLRDRAERARLFNLVLAERGLTLQDWEGSSYILRDRKGRSAVVPDLARVWDEAERMLGDALDPLDPELLGAMRKRYVAHESDGPTPCHAEE